jgi:hypothetical protein
VPLNPRQYTEDAVVGIETTSESTDDDPQKILALIKKVSAEITKIRSITAHGKRNQSGLIVTDTPARCLSHASPGPIRRSRVGFGSSLASDD